jgi:glycosyltransferase involved in cell wall biosynthesis
VSSTIGAGATPAPRADGKLGLVMLCDVDFGFPDATRTHTVEVAQGFARAGLDVDLVARGPDPRLDGVRYTRADGSEEQRVRRLATINVHAIGLLWGRRRAADRFYARDSWSCLPSIVAARLLSYRVVTQVDGIPYGRVAGEAPTALGYLKLVVAVIVGRLSTGVLAVTPQIKQLLIDLARVPADRIAVVPNGVDLDFFEPESRSEAIRRAAMSFSAAASINGRTSTRCWRHLQSSSVNDPTRDCCSSATDRSEAGSSVAPGSSTSSMRSP